MPFLKTPSCFLLLFALLFGSCSKEEDEEYQAYIPQRENSDPYYFAGTITDTTNGNAVDGTSLVAFNCGTSGALNSIGADGKYVMLFTPWQHKGMHCSLNDGIDLTLFWNDSVHQSIIVFPGKGIPNDTVQLDLFF